MKARVGSKALVAVVAIGGLLACAVTWWSKSESASLRAQEQQALGYVEADAVEALQATVVGLRRVLDDTLLRESATPFYQYNNVYADPLASSADRVVPSPLAQDSRSPWVSAHFQVDAAGDVTMPTLNPTEPSLSNARLAGAHRDVARQLAAHLDELRLPAPAVLMAAATATPARRAKPVQPKRVAASDAPELDQPLAPTDGTTQLQLQPGAASEFPDVAQNNVSNSYVGPSAVAQQTIISSRRQAPQVDVANQDGLGAPNAQQTIQAIQFPEQNLYGTEVATKKYLAQTRGPTQPAAPRTVTVIVEPFEWMALSLDGAPTLVAVRSVEAPTGGLRQGFVVPRAALTAFLAQQPYQPTLQTVSRAATDTDDPTGHTALQRPLNLASAPATLAGWTLAIDELPELAAVRAAYATRRHGLAMEALTVALLALVATLLAGFFILQAERLAHQRSQFAATAAHELRTPLASLQLHGELLAHGLGDPAKSAVYAQRMADEAGRLGRVVANVLGYAQLEQNTLATAPRLDDVRLTIGLVVDRHRAMFAQADMVLHWDDDVGAPVMASFDRDALDRVLTNLLDNAEKYTRGTPQRAAWVTLTSEPDGVGITVRDNGPGIASPAARRLFRPFSRGRETGPDGLGLGLALSRTLCRGMGGELAVKPCEHGAAFVVRLRQAPPR